MTISVDVYVDNDDLDTLRAARFVWNPEATIPDTRQEYLQSIAEGLQQSLGRNSTITVTGVTP